MSTPLTDALRERAAAHGLAMPLAAGAPATVDVIRAVKAIPYARPSADDLWTVLEQWRGLGPIKHYLLGICLGELGVPVRVVHRAATLTPAVLAAALGPELAHLAPAEGVPAVHTYLLLEQGGAPVALDVTYPGPWRGDVPMPLACGPGTDYQVTAGADPEHLRGGLEMLHGGPKIHFRQPVDDVIDAIAAALAG
jgi:hypothetical protein